MTHCLNEGVWVICNTENNIFRLIQFCMNKVPVFYYLFLLFILLCLIIYMCFKLYICTYYIMYNMFLYIVEFVIVIFIMYINYCMFNYDANKTTECKD